LHTSIGRVHRFERHRSTLGNRTTLLCLAGFAFASGGF
jgi:hypothetical protein